MATVSRKKIWKDLSTIFYDQAQWPGNRTGLSLSYDITKAHVGELKVDSKTGEGTEFIIKIPL
jgi:signal transduction histidine kinase